MAAQTNSQGSNKMDPTSRMKGTSSGPLTSKIPVTKRKSRTLETIAKTENLTKRSKNDPTDNLHKELKYMRALYGQDSNKNRLAAAAAAIRPENTLEKSTGKAGRNSIIIPQGVNPEAANKFTPNSESWEEILWTKPKKTNKSPNAKNEHQNVLEISKSRCEILQETITTSREPTEVPIDVDMQRTPQVNNAGPTPRPPIDTETEAIHHHQDTTQQIPNQIPVSRQPAHRR